MKAGLQRALLGATLVVAALVAACAAPPVDPAPQPTIIFVVLDTVRSDHLSLCGYERPTSPKLEQLVTRAGAASTCRAYAPGDWTLPSHASFFTGRVVTEHGARIARHGPVLADVRVVPLADAHSTLAEQLGERGYQTVAVSANPVLAADSGLLQGFDEWYVAEAFGTLSGRPLVERVEGLLAEVDPRDGPLFLFVNIADAHGPWREIPESIGWLPPRRSLMLALSRQVSPYRRYVLGELDEDQTAAARDHYVDVYDFGVYRADRTLGLLLDSLESGGWLDGHHRLLVTSDHGEFLVERGLVGHGGHLFEANNRIPLIYLDSEQSSLALTEPLSGLAPFYLARDGRFSAGEPPTAVAFPNVRMLRLLGEDLKSYNQTAVGLWSENEKWLWIDGDLQRFDLLADPAETNPESVETSAMPERLDEEIADLATLSSRTPETHEALLEKLRALGYVD